ncbi:MAG: prepilin peptidase [candidate division Zixibacteria bacterium]|nr:prepilin peptidase [candidate division Zixibacteria bacterium]
MNMLIGAFVFIFGLAVGSFLNVCIYRLPLKKSIIFPASHCPKCGNKIRTYDNIPILSYILLRGKCRFCKERISLIYPAVELWSGLIFLSLYLWYGLSWEFASKLFLFTSLMVIFFIDLKHQLIPDVITLPGIAAGLIFSLLSKSPSFLDSLIGIISGGGLFYLVALAGDKIFKKESMGGGDIKLAAMLGAFLGWQKILLVFFLASFLGALAGIIFLILSPKLRENRLIPFGPFLAIATAICIFFGNRLVELYLNLFFHI